MLLARRRRSQAAAAVPLVAAAGDRPGVQSELITGGSRLSEGAIIHATVRARVFGVKLLRLEASVHAAPAQLRKVDRLLSVMDSTAPGREVAARRPTGPPAELRMSAGDRAAIGTRLDEALVLLDEGAASLAAVTAPHPPPHLR